MVLFAGSLQPAGEVGRFGLFTLSFWLCSRIDFEFCRTSSPIPHAITAFGRRCRLAGFLRFRKTGG
jgi:hypothetical protein